MEGLRHDITNAPYHAFGEHANCRSYFCKKKDESMDDATDTSNIIPELKSAGIWDKIMLAVDKTAAKAEFLCENRTSNLYVYSNSKVYFYLS